MCDGRCGVLRWRVIAVESRSSDVVIHDRSHCEIQSRKPAVSRQSIHFRAERVSGTSRDSQVWRYFRANGGTIVQRGRAKTAICRCSKTEQSFDAVTPRSGEERRSAAVKFVRRRTPCGIGPVRLSKKSTLDSGTSAIVVRMNRSMLVLYASKSTPPSTVHSIDRAAESRGSGRFGGSGLTIVSVSVGASHHRGESRAVFTRIYATPKYCRAPAHATSARQVQWWNCLVTVPSRSSASTSSFRKADRAPAEIELQISGDELHTGQRVPCPRTPQEREIHR